MAANDQTSGIIAKINEYINSQYATTPAKAELMTFLRTGTVPTDPRIRDSLLSFLAGTQYEKNPAGFISDYKATIQNVQNGAPMAGAAAATATAVPKGSQNSVAANAVGAAASATPSLAERVAAAARSAAGGAGVDIGDGATPPPMSTAGGGPGQILHAPPGTGASSGGISSANDNGIGGGGPQGDAATRASIQQALSTASQNGKLAATQYPTAGPTAPTSGGMGPQGGGYTAGQAQALSQDDDQLIRFAMQQAGLNPDRLTKFSKIAGQALVPLLRARRAAFGIAGDGNVGGLPDDIAGVAKSFTSGSGGDFYNQQRQYAQQAMGSDNFKNAIAGLGDQEQVAAMYQSLMPLQYAGSNPLIQQSAADTFQRQQNQFNDSQFNTSLAGRPDPSGGIFTQFLQNQQNLDPITKRIFGLR